MSWYAPFQSSQTRQQLFMFSFYHISPTDDMNHKLLSSFYLMTSKNILSSYSHGSLLLLKYLMLTCLFIWQCSQKSPWNTKTWKKLSVLLEYFTRGLLQTVKLRSAYHGCYSTWLAKMFWYHHLKSNNPGIFCQICFLSSAAGILIHICSWSWQAASMCAHKLFATQDLKAKSLSIPCSNFTSGFITKLQ